MNTKIQVYAVVRIDASQSIEEAITIKEILPTMEQAVREVERLNELNDDKDCQYFWQLTRYFPEGREINNQLQPNHLKKTVKAEDLSLQR